MSILGSDRGNKTSTLKVKDTLSFEIWLFRNGQHEAIQSNIVHFAKH